MKKYLLFIIMLVVVLPVAHASEEEKCDIGEVFNGIIIKDGIQLKEKKINYYCEFSDSAQAMLKFKAMYPEILKYIKEHYSLNEIDSNNWSSYYKVIREEILPFDNYDLFMMNAFFDIYENTNENIKIEKMINEYKQKKSVQLLNSIENLTPNFTEKESSFSKSYISSTTPYATQSFNVNTGVSYAEKYAWNANTSRYGTLNPDDANFASQILNNGGYSQTSQQAYGWWCQSIGYITNCSDSWKNANAFVNHFGVKNGYQRNFQIFSQNVSRGDFIAIDITGDGNYDRIGFITYKSNDLKQYSISKNGVTSTAIFYDFIVAQHSNNYNSWVSEDINDWEYGILTKAKYAVVNINKL